jgi:hypothetical protein
MDGLLKQLSRMVNLTPVEGTSAWASFENATPSFRFHYRVREATARKALIHFAIRDAYAPEAAQELCFKIDEMEDRILEAEEPRKLHPVALHASRFDSLVVLPPGFHESLSAQDPDLSARTFVVFPAYGCEFRDVETKACIDVLRRGIVATLDWSRDPSPRVEMRYSNPRTKGGSRGSKRGLTDISVPLREARELAGSPGAFIEIENFTGQVLRVESNGDHVAVRRSPQGVEEFATVDELPGLIRRFLESA